jgi:Zn-dependent protease with chaperone function
MTGVLSPALLVVVAVGLVVLFQWLLDSPVFEPGAASWFPSASASLGNRRTVRLALAGLVPTLGFAGAAVLVFTTPFDVWLWGVVALLAATVALSPLFAVYHYEVRPPTPSEQATIAESLPDLDCEVLVVSDASDGTVNGYAIGGPFRDVIGISEFALTQLPPEQVGALLAHEACHHEERHVLIRGAVSVAVLGAGAAVLTTAFDALVLLATLSLLVLVFLERVVSYYLMRWLEFRADAAAADRTDRETVSSLFASLDDAIGGESTPIPALFRLFSTHPTYAARIRRLQQ